MLNLKREFQIHATKWQAIKCMAHTIWHEFLLKIQWKLDEEGYPVKRRRNWAKSEFTRSPGGAKRS